MNTYYLSKCWVVLVALSITLSATSSAIALGEATSGNALLKGATASATLSSASHLALNTPADRTLDEYQPPDNGGPGKTGGSSTRWQQGTTAKNC